MQLAVYRCSTWPHALPVLAMAVGNTKADQRRGECVILRAEFMSVVTKTLSDVQTIQNRTFQIDYYLAH